jgi:hypothetical protein
MKATREPTPGEVHLMGDDHCHALAGEPAHDQKYLASPFGIERRGWRTE